MPNPECPRCKGTGWIIVEQDGLSAARPCGCLDPAAPRAEARAGIPRNYEKAGLENFSLAHLAPPQQERMMQCMHVVRGFAREFPLGDKPGLLLVGEPGTGKTHLAVAALRILLGRGHEGVFFNYAHLLERIKNSYNELSGFSDRDAFQTALDAEILLLDDLGSHRVSDWVLDTVTRIITHRCDERKCLIATTNLPDPDAGMAVLEKDAMRPSGYAAKVTLAERVGARARSRLFEMCRIVVMPPIEDYRVRRMR